MDPIFFEAGSTFFHYRHTVWPKSEIIVPVLRQCVPRTYAARHADIFSLTQDDGMWGANLNAGTRSVRWLGSAGRRKRAGKPCKNGGWQVHDCRSFSVSAPPRFMLILSHEPSRVNGKELPGGTKFVRAHGRATFFTSGQLANSTMMTAAMIVAAAGTIMDSHHILLGLKRRRWVRRPLWSPRS